MSILQLNRPTLTDVGQQIERLCAVFGKPFQANAKVMADEWHRSLAPRFSRETIAAAVNLCGENDSKFPTLKRLREFCFEVERQTMPARTKGIREEFAEWEVHPWEGPCPVCGSTVEQLPRGDLMVHDDAVHTERRISYSNFGNPEWRHLPRLEDPKPAPRSKRVADNPAAKPLPRVADVLPATPAKPRKPLDPEVESMRAKIPPSTQRIWEDVPLPPAPPEALLTR